MAPSTNNSQRFLNILRPYEVTDFITALLPPGSHLNLVNHRRFFTSSVTMDQLATMRSIRPQDGAFFTRWMECKIKEHHLNQPPPRYPCATLILNGKAWPQSVQQRFNKFCVSNNINKLTILSHHIILRSVLDRSGRRLPSLVAKKNHKQASHLCDTIGCLSEEHLCIEKREFNKSRTRCQGIVLHIFGNTAADFCIFQADPCQHGLQHEEADELTSTGRPIDGIISPIHALSAYPHDCDLSAGYTGIANLLQLSSVILPITKVNLELDKRTDEYNNIKIASEFDKMTQKIYKGPEIFENCTVCLQIICRRLEDEKAIGMAMIIENVLKLY